MTSKSEFVIGLAGYGTVGQGLAAILRDNAQGIADRVGRGIRIGAVAVRDLRKARSVAYPDGARLVTDLMALATDPEIDCVVELMGGIGQARTLIETAIAGGKHVVTANKHLLAEHGAELFESARSAGVGLYYEASVCGGIPIVGALKEGLAANRVRSLMGILNGTANYILTKMTESGLPFDKALAKAQAKGYAEADPSFDIEGIDAAHKLTVLIRLAYGRDYPLKDLPVEGITKVTPLDISFADEFGYVVKLIGHVRDENGRLCAGVQPMLVSKNYLLANVKGAFNAVRVEGDAVGPVTLYGKGAGGPATGSAVAADLMALARLDGHHDNTGFAKPLAHAHILPPNESRFRHYFRFQAEDRPGVMAAIAKAMGDNGVSIAQAVQKGEADGDPEGGDVPIVFLTHEAPYKAVKAVIKEIDGLGFIKAPTVHFRVL